MPVPGKIEKAADHGGSGGNTNKHFFHTHSFFKSGLQFHILLPKLSAAIQTKQQFEERGEASPEAPAAVAEDEQDMEL